MKKIKKVADTFGSIYYRQEDLRLGRERVAVWFGYTYGQEPLALMIRIGDHERFFTL